jgi:UDP-N-acetylmuramate dehydrogenase
MTEWTVFQRKIADFLPDIDLKMNESLARHTSFRIGGPAEVMAFPKSAEELSCVLKAAKKLAVTPVILGAGTNVLAPDEGLEGLVICLKDCLGGMERLNDTAIRIYAGVTMARAAVFAAGLGLSGMEFAHGIPGTVGGGVYMNAGAYGGEISQVCTQVSVMDMDGNQKLLSNEEMGFSYRNSRIQQGNDIVLFADFALQPQPEVAIREKMQELQAKRRASQPLDLPSAGSAFKRPATGYAAAMIDQAGLKGFQIGGAAVSEKHAGFVVNLGGATASDVRTLLAAVADKVESIHGVRLEPEVRIW